VLIASLLVLRLTHTRLGVDLFDCLPFSKLLKIAAHNPQPHHRKQTVTATTHANQPAQIPNHIYPSLDHSPPRAAVHDSTMPALWKINLAIALAIAFYFVIEYLVNNGMGWVVVLAADYAAAIYLGIKNADAIGWVGDRIDPEVRHEDTSERR